MSDPPLPSGDRSPHDRPTAEGGPVAENYKASAVGRARNLLDEMPAQIGRYRILERIGGGGMGEVYRAEQRAPVRREVAIKLIKLGMDTKLVIARFEAERQALAMMEHPNIAKVYDADADATGRPYFVMEYVKGKPITEYADANHLTIDERLELFEQVCDAIQHAHHKGVIHRDLKPGNVLVSTHDGKPHAKVIDFGIAKAISQRLTDKTLYTQHEQFVGTPQYVSPEQADGSLDIDTRTDVYSLGVLLYELLAGSTPFVGEELRAAAVEKIKEMIREVDPPRPSTRLSMSAQTLPALAAARRADPKKLGALVRGELDWIVMKALEKDRRRRYETPAALAGDVRAHLSGQPVTAAPPTTGYRLRKFVSRNKGPLAAATALGLALLVGAVVSTWQALRAGRAEQKLSVQIVEVNQQRQFADIARQDAEEARTVAEQQAKLATKSASLSRARYLIQQGDLPGAMASIDQAATAGLSYADRLILDEAYRASREHWTLVSHVRTGIRPDSGCVVDFNDGRAVVVAIVGNELLSYAADTPKPAWQRTPLDITPQELLPTRAGVVVGWTSSGRVLSFEVAPDKIVPLAKNDFHNPIDTAASSDNTVTPLFLDGSCKTLDARTLKVIHEWPAKALPESIRTQRNKRCFASPDGNLVLVHRGAHNMPVYALRPGDTEAAEIKNIRMEHLSFFPPVPRHGTTKPASNSRPEQRFVTWLPGSGELSTYSLSGHGQLSYTNWQLVEFGDTKRGVALRAASHDRMTLFGEVGATRIQILGTRAPLPPVRYTSFWPFAVDAPEFLAANEFGERIVLSIRDGLILFKPRTESFDWTMRRWPIQRFSGIPSGVLRTSAGEPPTVALDPYDPNRPKWSTALQWINPNPSTVRKSFSPWGMHVTSDERYAVILVQENDDEDGSSRKFGREFALVYNLQGDVRREAGWKNAVQVEMSTVAAASGYVDGPIRLTPDGKTVLFGMRSELHRYDVATGKALNIMDFNQSEFELSRDGTLVVGRPGGAKEVGVYDTTTLQPRCTLAGAGSFLGGAIADDNKSVVVKSTASKLMLYEIPSGREVWSKESALIPRCWPAAGDHMLAMVPETRGDGAMLVLADKATLEPLGVISKTFDYLGVCGFSPTRDAIYTQVSPWQSRIIPMVDPAGLARLIKTPAGAVTSSAGQPSDAVVDARPTRLATTSASQSADNPLRAEDVAQFSKYMDQIVTVEAVVARVVWTSARNAFNIECAGDGTGNNPPLTIWVYPEMLRRLRDDGLEIEPEKPSLEGRRLRIRGRVRVYGGYDPKFKGRPQITIEDPKAFTVRDD